jgi:hypothetical protein
MQADGVQDQVISSCVSPIWTLIEPGDSREEEGAEIPRETRGERVHEGDVYKRWRAVRVGGRALLDAVEGEQAKVDGSRLIRWMLDVSDRASAQNFLSWLGDD